MLVSNLGINILRSSLSEQLSSIYVISFTNDDAERERSIKINGAEQKEASVIIHNAFDEHVKQIINYAKGRKISFANSEILIIGGGSILLREQLMKHFPNASYLPKEDAPFSNTLSYLKILEAKFGERTKA